MGRPRLFDRDVALASAKDLFWERGFAGSSMSDIERTTRMSRPSLYATFGSKDDLFASALTLYIDTFMSGLLSPMEAAGAEPAAAAGFFESLARRFAGEQRVARRGCLWVNSIAEFASQGGGASLSRAREYRDRIHAAFTNALTMQTAHRAAREASDVRAAARTWTAATFGVWLEARIDPRQASATARALAAAVRTAAAG
jgi:TetR/AcrR family transcriptional repressor of nem operon